MMAYNKSLQLTNNTPLETLYFNELIMKKVYESSTALEAYMVKNLLASEGIESRVDGEHLQGGIGELQAVGIVRVVVDETTYLKAKEILDKWESEQSNLSFEKPKTRSNTLVPFLLGSALTAGLAFWVFSSPVTTDGIDYNGDGFMDEKWVYKGDRIKETSIDRNLDGTYDYVYYYDLKGLVKSAKADDNFDGIFETEITYRNGTTTAEESDKDQNGIVDYRVKYEYGVLHSIEFIDEASTKIKKRQRFGLGKLVSADYDSNGDGVLDTHYSYDKYEESK
ncbi:MAG: DUF2007 domain-containing protein [Candidatus Sedimenticola sp. PURPLELP]